jgi:uncharacterized membrane protein YgcG
MLMLFLLLAVNERVSGASVLSRKVIAMLRTPTDRTPFPAHWSSASLQIFPLLAVALFVLVSSSPAIAEVRVVNAQGEYRMGDRDTREDAIRLATEAAKRNALEQVATYLESVTVVDGMDITKDEIRTYTAGVVLVLDQRVSTSLDGDTVVIKVDLVTQVDTEEVANAIVALRENEDARHQLVALQQEMDQLQSELDAANLALQQASTADGLQQATQQRQDLLNRAQSNAMVAQAWTDWVLVSPVVYPYPWVGVAQANASLNVARKLYPNSPHVQIAQNEMVTKQPPLPLQPPAPAVQDQAQLSAARPVPLTLNEISHTTHTAPPHIGNQPITSQSTTVPIPPGSRTLTEVRQLNPLLSPPQNGTLSTSQQTVPPNSRSARALQQFLQPPPTGGGQPQAVQPPIARRLPPTINQIHPPMPHQVPRMPYHFGPRSFGGGGGMGGGRGGGWGGGRGGGGRGGGRGR